MFSFPTKLFEPVVANTDEAKLLNNNEFVENEALIALEADTACDALIANDADTLLVANDAEILVNDKEADTLLVADNADIAVDEFNA